MRCTYIVSPGSAPMSVRINEAGRHHASRHVDNLIRFRWFHTARFNRGDGGAPAHNLKPEP